MKFERRDYRWRMYDAQVMLEARRREPFVLISTLIPRLAMLARFKGLRVHGPSKINRHFAPLSTDMLDMRRIGLNPRILAGRGL